MKSGEDMLRRRTERMLASVMLDGLPEEVAAARHALGVSGDTAAQRRTTVLGNAARAGDAKDEPETLYDFLERRKDDDTASAEERKDVRSCLELLGRKDKDKDTSSLDRADDEDDEAGARAMVGETAWRGMRASERRAFLASDPNQSRSAARAQRDGTTLAMPAGEISPEDADARIAELEAELASPRRPGSAR